jgi:hypothetical protein
MIIAFKLEMFFIKRKCNYPRSLSETEGNSFERLLTSASLSERR